MARPFVLKEDEQTRVPFLRGILTRSLQNAGLTFEESYRVASSVREELSDTEEITTVRLRERVLAHLEAYGDEVVERYRNPRRAASTVMVDSPDHGTLPFSRGRHSQDLLAAGLTSEDATVISERLYIELLGQKRASVTSAELRSRTHRHIERGLGREAAHRYHVWQEFGDGDRPLLVLIGGAVGCGKSTIATELAHRLSIVRIQSSDMLREVMRTMISPRLLPILHESTYTAWKALPAIEEGPDDGEASADEPDADALEGGFLNQSELVSVASDAVLRRAIQERVSIIVEGVHVHPGFARRIPTDADAIVVQVMLAVLAKKRLRERIKGRGRQAPARRAERYLRNFDGIWEIQSYLLAEADRLGVPIVENEDRDATVGEVVRIVLDALAWHHQADASETAS
jgi:2-phosphoglycerate kinase